jgi:hypothetical protein
MTTKIADVIVPQVFNPYVVQRSMEVDALIQAGIVENSTLFDGLAASGGKLVNMPYWNDLTGADEVLSESGALTPGKIDAGQDVAALLMRGRAWGVNDLAKALSGDDPMRVIGNLVADYWRARRQATLISILKGIFAAASMAGNVSDISGQAGAAAVISGQTTIDAGQKLGDAKGGLTAIAMHSAVEAKLAKDDLIQYVQVSGQSDRVPTYLSKRVIVDDGCPVNAGVYDTYLFGPGAFALGNGNPPVPTETDRDSLAGEDYLINRQHYVLHPRGVKFTAAAVVGASPSNGELENAANWNRVYDNKAIRMVLFRHKIA